MSKSSKEKSQSTKKIMIIISILIFLIFSTFDRLTKIYANNRLKDHPNVSFIPGKLELHYLENEGAAFGLLKGQEAFFIFVSIIIIGSIIFVIAKIPGKSKFIPAVVLLSFIITGASGNMIDRIIYHHVIDFIFVSMIKFPIFNVADIYVSVSSLLLVLLIIFKYNEEDLNFLRVKEKKLREI